MNGNAAGSYVLVTTQQPGYLHCSVSGRNSAAAVRGYLAEIHAACVARNCSAVLIEENLSGPSLDIGAIFGIASAGSAATAPAIRAIAYVDTNPEHSPAKMKFAETVAMTRGINIRMFASIAAAQLWLRNYVAGYPGEVDAAPPQQEES